MTSMQISDAFKLIHILAVISAVGANLTYAFWLGRAGRDGDQLVFVIESIRRLDRRVANPSYIVAAIAGACVVITGPFHFESAWLLTAIAIYVLVAVLGISVYAPAVRVQLALARTAPESDAYAAAARRSRLLGLLVTLMVLLIVALMVVKPVLWAA
jgi:uncharacterized membrane protein